MIILPPQLDNNPLESEINPTYFHVRKLSMDFSKVKDVDKVAKKTNFVVYSSLFKVGGVEKAIEKLKEDLKNAKAKEKASDNMCK